MTAVMKMATLSQARETELSKATTIARIRESESPRMKIVLHLAKSTCAEFAPSPAESQKDVQSCAPLGRQTALAQCGGHTKQLSCRCSSVLARPEPFKDALAQISTAFLPVLLDFESMPCVLGSMTEGWVFDACQFLSLPFLL